MIIVLAVGATVVKSTSSTSTSAVQPGTRAVVVPTADAARTVVVAPCGTGASVLSVEEAVSPVTGSTSIELPQGQGERIVLIPPCSGGQGGTAGVSALPSAAFVPRPGTAPPSIGSSPKTNSPQAGAPDTAQFELMVPAGSAIRTIVISPCQRPRSSGPAEQILSVVGHSSTAVAPAC